jgi:hypothetical protein
MSLKSRAVVSSQCVLICMAIRSVMKSVYGRSVASHGGDPQLTARESFEVFKTIVMQHATATSAGETPLFDFPAITRVSVLAIYISLVYAVHCEHNL